MFCSQCGKQIPDRSNFCQFCGCKVQGISPGQNTMNTPKRRDGVASMADTPTDRQRYMEAVSNKKNAHFKKWLPISLLIILILLIAVSIPIYIMRNRQNEPGSDNKFENEASTKSPIVVVAGSEGTDLQLLYFSDFHKPKRPVVITTYDSSRYTGYSGEGDRAFFSNDGKYLYYFDMNSDMADVGICALYRVLTEELNDDIVSPELIDDYVMMETTELSYVMETLDNGRLLYLEWEETDEGYREKLCLYKDGSSSTLLTGSEIYVSVNHDRTFANIAVKNENNEIINGWTWYRMDLGENSAPQFVCEGIMGTNEEARKEYDYQALTDKDLIINVMDRGEGNGYNTVDLYEHGEFSKKLFEYYPRFSVGPFGITVKDNQDVSFFTISTADGNSTIGGSNQGFSQSWAFFQYKDGTYQEVSGISRFQTYLPENEIDLHSLRSVGDSVKYIKRDFPGSIWHYKAFDEDGNEILFEISYSGDVDVLYAETSNKKKQLMEGSYIEEEIYDLDGKKYLVAWGPDKIFSTCLDDLTVDSIDNAEAVDGTDEYIVQMLPCDAKTIFVVTQQGMYEWDGHELTDSKIGSILGNVEICSVWSRGRKIGYNVPNN